MPLARRTKAVQLPRGDKRHASRDLGVPKRHDVLRLYASTTRSFASVGLPFRVWTASEYSVYCCPASYAQGSIDEQFEVSFPLYSPLRKSDLATRETDPCEYHSPGKILQKLPSLNSEKIIGLAIVALRKIPDDVYDELVRHAQ